VKLYEEAFDGYGNIKNIQACPKVTQQVLEVLAESRQIEQAEHSRKKRITYKDIVSMLHDDLYDGADPLYEDTDAGSYIISLCHEVEEQLGVWLETSIQSGQGSITIFDMDDNALVADIDFAEFDNEVINIALDSQSPSKFKRKYTSYLKHLLK
jgi:hypothetical protein